MRKMKGLRRYLIADPNNRFGYYHCKVQIRQRNGRLSSLMGAAEQPFSRRVVFRKMMTMTAILLVFLQCLVIQQYHNNNGLFVAGFATSKQIDVLSSSPYHTFPSLETPTAITTNCRMHKTRLWFGNSNNNEEEEEDAGTNFFTSSGGDSSRGRQKKRVAVSVDVNVKIARDKKTTEETTSYDIREEMMQEFYQEEEVIDSFAADDDDDYDSSPSDEIMMTFPEALEDFNNDDSNYYDIVAEDYEQEETSSVEEYYMSDYEQEETSVEEYYMSEIPPSSLLKAIEPTKDKPTKKFVSPIQSLKQA